MKYAIIGARILLGLVFLVFGLNYFLKFLEMPPAEGHAGAFLGALFASGYLGAVKVLEIAGGALTMSGRYTPLGLLILGPIVVNIALYDLFLARAFNPLGATVAVLSLFLLIAYRKNFMGILAKPTGSISAADSSDRG